MLDRRYPTRARLRLTGRDVLRALGILVVILLWLALCRVSILGAANGG